MPVTKASFTGQSPVELRQDGDDDEQNSLRATVSPASEDMRATKTITPKKKGQKKITFNEGGLHASTGTPAGQKIPPGKMAAAKAGKLGPKAQKQANFAANVLTGGSRQLTEGGSAGATIPVAALSSNKRRPRRAP